MSQTLNKQLYTAIELLNDTQKKAVLNVVKAFTGQGKQEDHWQEEQFVAEMESRYNYYKKGGQMITAAEADKRIKELLKKVKAK